MATAAGEDDERLAAEVPLALRRFGATPNPYLELMRRRGQGALSPPHAPVKGGADDIAMDLPPLGPSPPTSPTAAATAAATAPGLPPPWLRKDDREVLRYFCYLLEAVYEGGDAGQQAAVRVRRFTACYFTASEAFSVEEPRELNSGLPQGTFLRKQRIPKPAWACRASPVVPASGLKQQADGQQYWGPEDVEIGRALNFYGRDFIVIDADAFTRAWHERVLGSPLGDPAPLPDDGYRAKRQLVERPTRRQHLAAAAQQQQQQQASAAPGAATTTATAPTLSKKPLPYPQRDTKVLRFYGAYEDERGIGGRHRVTVYYYTEDDTLEVKEAPEPGRDPFPSMLKRSRVPKRPGQQLQRREEGAECYGYADLTCGASINIYGRRVLLLSCDASTIAWYAAKGIRQSPLHVATGADAAPPTPLHVAPPNGYGDDSDLFSLGLRLEPGKYEDRQERAERSQRTGSQVLRFKVHLLRNGMPDAGRDLILNYYMFDETVSIFEPPVRNSGQDGGLFLTRGRYKKYIEKTGADREAVLGGSLSRYLRPADFLLTAGPVTFEVATTGARLFTLATAAYEEHTRRALEDMGMVGDPRGPRAVRVALQRQAEAFVSASLPVRAVFRAAVAANDDDGGSSGGSSGAGTIAVATFVTLVRELEVQAGAPALPEEEMVAVAAVFARPASADGGGPAVVCYDDYVDALCMCAPKTVLGQAKEAIGAGQLTAEERVLKALGIAYQHGQPLDAVLLRKTLRALDPAGTGQVDFDHWSLALKALGLNELMSKDAAATLLLQYDAAGAGCLSYHDLCDAVFVGDFDMALAPTATGSPRGAGGGGGAKAKKHDPPTIERYLAEVTQAALRCEGDSRQQLENAIHAFSSCFSRLPRKRILRKIWSAFDASGLITGPQFSKGLEEAAVECRVDFAAHDRAALAAFIFPAEASAGAAAAATAATAVDFENLLEAMCSRDIARVAAVRDAGLAARARLEEQTVFKEADTSRSRDFGSILKGAGLVA